MAHAEGTRIRELTAEETARSLESHKKSKKPFERAKAFLLARVPMNWMVR